MTGLGAVKSFGHALFLEEVVRLLSVPLDLDDVLEM